MIVQAGTSVAFIYLGFTQESGADRVPHRVPCTQQALQTDEQLFRQERLVDVVACTRLERLHDVLFAATRGQNDDRHIAARAARADPAQAFHPVTHRHHGMESDGSGPFLREAGEGFPAAMRDDRLVASGPQPEAKHFGSAQAVPLS